MAEPQVLSYASVDSAQPALRRVVSRWEIVAFSINDVIGSGVYLLPAAAAAVLGVVSIWAVLAAGFAVLLLVLCFAEASSYFDKPGGAYVYTRTAFGELVGFEVGWMTWIARVSSVASLSVGFAQALSYFWPEVAGGWQRTVTITVPLLALTVINVIGVKSGIRTAVFLAISKTLPLLLFIAAGVFAVSGDVLTFNKGEPDRARFGEAALLLLFAYAGFENTPAPAGEFKNPKRDVPFALIAQIVIVTLIYSLVQFVGLGTLPGVAGSQTPLADSARLFLGSWGGWLMTFGAAVSILGTNSNTVLAGPRYLYALASDGFGPRSLAYVHPRFRTPVVAVILQSAIALPLALTGSFVQLAALSVVARLATYFGTAIAVPFLRRKFKDNPAKVRLPFGPTIPIAAALLCVVFAASAEKKNLIAGAIALAVGFVIALLAAGRRPPYNPPPMQTHRDLIVEPVGLDVDTAPKPIVWRELFGNDRPVEIEIGMGKGTFITDQAKARPDFNFFGIEWARFFWRYASDRLRRNGCAANARTIRAEASFFLREFVEPESVAALHIYFPDPWPKARHHKRRLIQPPFLQLVRRILSSGGRLQVVTDHKGYWEENIEPVVRATEGFTVVEYVRPGSAGEGETVGTNFERKYQREGRPFYAIAAVKT